MMMFTLINFFVSLDIQRSTVFIFVLALIGVFYPYNRGALFTALVVIYALTSGIAGYTATAFYCQLEGTNWVRHFPRRHFLIFPFCCFAHQIKMQNDPDICMLLHSYPLKTLAEMLA